MQTTLDIDDDVLIIIQKLSSQRGQTIGQTLSQLARESLRHETAPTLRNGVPVFPNKPGAPPVTLDLVNQLRDGAIPFFGFPAHEPPG